MRLPPAYTLLAQAHVRAAVRRDLVPTLAPWLLAPALALPRDAEPIAGGRGAAYRIVLAGGIRAVVRLYRRGGLLARFVRETYVGVRPRPLRELVLTDEARRRGVAAVEVLAARVEGRFTYRGALVTAEVPGTVTLIEALRAHPDDGTRRALAESTGRAIAAMHRAGVFHADLNLTNILVHAEPPAVAAMVDFDRARLSSGLLASGARRRNLRRLWRSLGKLDPERTLSGPRDVAAFRAAYGAAAGVPCAC